MMARVPLLLLVVLGVAAIATAANVDPSSAAAAAPAAAAPPAAAAERSGSSGSQLLMVYSIQRHGARNVLPKSSLLAESEATGGPTLLPQGKRQCRAAGRSFAARYIEPTTCRNTSTCLAPDNGAGGFAYGIVGKPGVGFSNYNVFSNSSALDRTIMSAGAFLSGVFPSSPAAPPTSGAPDTAADEAEAQSALVPVFTVAEHEDWRIRGYTRCPAYERRLADWLLHSPEFAQKSKESAALRERVGKLVPHLNNSLANWWNVYDALNVWRTYGVGEPTPPLDNATFADVVELAYWLETRKMAPALAGNLLGGAIVGDLLGRLEAAERGSSGGQHYRLLSVSSHYNTQLGVLAALQRDEGEQEPHVVDHLWRDRIPALASVLAFELHGSSGGGQLLAVRVVAQNGPAAAWVVVPLPCAQQGDAAEQLAGPGACSLAAFRALAGPRALNSSRAWCDACSNTKVLACRAAAMERQLAEVGLSGESTSPLRRYSSPAMVAAWCLVSVVAAAAAALVAVLATRLVRHRRGAAGAGGGLKTADAEHGQLRPVQQPLQRSVAGGDDGML